MLKTIILSFIILFISGCAQKITIETVNPAIINRATVTKNIFVDDFKNDYNGFKTKLQGQLAQKEVYGKLFFTVIDKKNLDTSINGQKIEYLGVPNKNNKESLNQLIKPEAVVSGEVIDESVFRDYYRESRLRCIDERCKVVREYFIRCVRETYNFSARIKMVDTQRGEVIFANRFSKSSSHDDCHEHGVFLPNIREEMDYLSSLVIDDFISKISPYTTTYSVELLDEPEIKYSDKQKELLKYSLEYIKNGDFVSAQRLLSELLKSTNDSCFVAAYNLALIKESQRDFEEAKKLYNLSKSLVLKPNKLIDAAQFRIEDLIRNDVIIDRQIRN